MSSMPSFCGWVTVPQAANPSWLSQQLPVLLDGDFLSSMGATRAGHAHCPGSAFPISGCCLGSDLRKRQERWVSWSWPGRVFLLQGLDATSRLFPVPNCPVFLLPLSPSVTQARGHLSLPEDRKLQ
uniref:Uncharacterized protein n=1 Tax=Gorilla gorilla gorilla TaxID=9595 RepID=A0A2I2Z8J7_GORGO